LDEVLKIKTLAILDKPEAIMCATQPAGMQDSHGETLLSDRTCRTL